MSIPTLEQAELDFERQWMEGLLREVPYPVWLKSESGIYLFANRAYHDLVAMPAGAIVGQTDYNLFPMTLASTLRKNDKIVFTSGQALQLNEWVTDAAGHRRLFQVTKAPAHLPGGRCFGVIGMAHEITEPSNMVDFASTSFDAAIRQLRTPLMEMRELLDRAAESLEDGDLPALLRTVRAAHQRIEASIDIAVAELGKIRPVA